MTRYLAAFAAALAAASAVLAVTGASLPLPTLRRPSTPGWVTALRREHVAPTRFIGASLAAAAVAWVVVAGLTGSPLVAAVPAVIVGLLPAAQMRARVQRRQRERLAAWPDTLRSLVSSLQGGQSVHVALLELGRSGPVALRDVWVRYGRLTDHGLPEARALETVRRELADPLSDRVCEVLILAIGRGSRIALRVLRDLADATAADVQLAERLETAAVEQRLNARAVFALPWITLIVLTARPSLFRDYYSSGAGARVLLLGAAMSTVGMLLVRRLSRVPVEPRVLLDDQEASA